MSQRNNTVGLRGISVLACAAIAGIVLGVHGWSARHAPSALGSIGGGRPAASSGPAAAPSPAPSEAPSGNGASASPATTVGPMLSSQSFAQYAFRVWPGPLSAGAKTAETGLSITVKRRGGGITVSAGVAGQPASSPQFYPTGARVYVIEAALGDDSGNSDFSLGDDGLVVTDVQGRIVQ